MNSYMYTLTYQRMCLFIHLYLHIDVVTHKHVRIRRVLKKQRNLWTERLNDYQTDKMIERNIQSH